MADEIIYLYKIRCDLNDKHYIGKTNNPDARWEQHKAASRLYDPSKDSDKPILLIDKEMANDGIEHFTFEVISSVKENATDAEMELIQKFGSHISTGRGYNVHLSRNIPLMEEAQQYLSMQAQIKKEKEDKTMQQVIYTNKTRNLNLLTLKECMIIVFYTNGNDWMRAYDIWKKMEAMGRHSGGKTPWSTLASIIGTNISDAGDNAIFEKEGSAFRLTEKGLAKISLNFI